MLILKIHKSLSAERSGDMPVTIRRYNKSTYVSKKKKLPEQLEFLKGINYFIIAEHKKGNIKQFIVEFKPTSIKNIISKAINVKKLRMEVDKLRENLKKLEKENESLKAEIVTHERVKKILQNELEKKKTNPNEKSPQNYYSIMEKKGFQMQGQPIQGGLPGLGKKN